MVTGVALHTGAATKWMRRAAREGEVRRGMRNGTEGRRVGYICRRAQGVEVLHDTGREWGPKERERVGKDRKASM